jgi:hypothetical protein
LGLALPPAPTNGLPRRQTKGKLGPKFFGPFKVLEQVGDVTYKLELPVGAKLHDVFHVGLLKSFCDDPPTSPGALPPIRHGHACLEPLAVTKSRIARGKLEVLVQWKELSTAACLVSVARRIPHALSRIPSHG